MTRRVRTLLVGFILLVALVALSLTLPVPYVILSPGPTYNTLGNIPDKSTPIIVVKGGTPKTTTGHLNLTTIDESTARVSVLDALIGWVQHDRIVVPRDSVIAPGTSQKQANQQDTQDFVSSQDNATLAAFCELNYPKGIQVEGFANGSKASGILQVGDNFVSINGQAATTVAELTAILAAAAPGTSATVVLERAGVTTTETVPLVAAPKGSKGARMGIEVESGCVAPFQIDLGLADQIGGPSAGLMFALGIIDKIGTVDLTGGTFIAGTGTIDATGAVGPIGGIQLKMIAARRAGATVFLAPDGNCADVRSATPKGLDVIKVDNLHDAIQYLLALQAHKPVPHC